MIKVVLLILLALVMEPIVKYIYLTIQTYFSRFSRKTKRKRKNKPLRMSEVDKIVNNISFKEIDYE